ncbi:hypothetical protein, partial [Aporhodopirellula aestuarii]
VGVRLAANASRGGQTRVSGLNIVQRTDTMMACDRVCLCRENSYASFTPFGEEKGSGLFYRH